MSFIKSDTVNAPMFPETCPFCGESIYQNGFHYFLDCGEWFQAEPLFGLFWWREGIDGKIYVIEATDNSAWFASVTQVSKKALLDDYVTPGIRELEHQLHDLIRLRDEMKEAT